MLAPDTEGIFEFKGVIISKIMNAPDVYIDYFAKVEVFFNNWTNRLNGRVIDGYKEGSADAIVNFSGEWREVQEKESVCEWMHKSMTIDDLLRELDAITERDDRRSDPQNDPCFAALAADCIRHLRGGDKS